MAPASRPRHIRWAPTLVLFCFLLLVAVPALASSGDRNPTFQNCLRGCSATYCDPSQPPIPGYLRIGGWSCEGNCKYACMHSFTDTIRSGSKWHQFYGKWPFYRLLFIQEPASVLFSLGNLYIHLRGLRLVRKRIRQGNRLGTWLAGLALVQMNTWIWSAVFHCRDTPTTERLDYFSATLTISSTLLYTLLRVLSLISPSAPPSRLAYLVIAAIASLVLSHFSYLLSFPLGQFPYGYHTAFNVGLATAHSLAWILWSAAFFLPFPSLSLGKVILRWPRPYPPHDPLRTRSPNARTPMTLVLLTTLAMSLELLDFAPYWRTIDAHSLWHAATIPLGAAWWNFLVQDAIELDTAGVKPSTPAMVMASGAETMEGAGDLGEPGEGAGEIMADFQRIAAKGALARKKG